MSILAAGDKVYAKQTITNQNCGIRPGDTGHVTFKDIDNVSFYLERRSGRGYMEAVCPLGVFVANFLTDWRSGGLRAGDLADGGMGTARNMSYLAKQHYTKVFPVAFL